MLQFMRHLAQHWFFKGLMLFLVISFAIWGIGDIFRGNPLQRSVAKAGNTTISIQALNRQFEDDLMRARQSLGPELTAQQAKQLGMLDGALQNMISRAALDQMLSKLGIDIPNRTVLDMLSAQPQLRDKDGKFNTELFHRMLEQMRMNEGDFISQTRQDLARRQLLDALTNGSAIPQTIRDNLYKARAQKRVLEIVTIKNNSIINIPAPDDKALQEFYDKNPNKFTAPEYRAITLARLSTEDVAKDIPISDDELKKEYDAKTTELTISEQRDILQVVLQDENKAKELSKAARVNHNLTAAAKAIGYEAVPLNGMTEKTILPDLYSSVFALGINEISEPVKSGLGWHVIQLKEVIPGGKPELSEIKDQLRESMKRDRAIDSMTKTLNQLDDDLAAAHSLEDIADSLKLRLIKIPALDAAGKTVEGKDPEELPAKNDALKTAFSQGSGEISPVIDDKNGNYIVIRTDGITPAQVRPLDQIKDQVIAEWKAAEQAKKAEEQAQDIAQSLRDGKTATSYAGRAGMEVRLSKPISLLGDRDSELPPAVLPQIEKMKRGEVITSVLPDHQIILRLTEITEADPASDEPGVNKVSGELAMQIPAELTDQYARYLRLIFPVEINQGVLETLRQEGS